MVLYRQISIVESFSSVKRRSVVALILYMLTFSVMFFYGPYAFLPLYNENRNISTTWTGAITGASGLGSIVASITAPMLLQMLSTKSLLVLPASGLGISFILFGLLDLIHDSTAFPIFAYICRFIGGLCQHTLRVTAVAALVLIYPNYLATATAAVEGVTNAGLAVAPFLGSLIYTSQGFIMASVIPGILVATVGSIPGLFLPDLKVKADPCDSGRQEEEKRRWSSLLDPLILFPLWHVLLGQLMVSYHMPLLPVYVRDAFGADAVWIGIVLTVNLGITSISSPLTGILVDKFGHYKMMVASSIAYPVIYVCIGPLPLLEFIHPSRLQLILALSLHGLANPLSFTPIVPIIFEVYRIRTSKDDLPEWVADALVAMFCGAMEIGLVIGCTASGFIAPYVSFRWSTGLLALMCVIEPVLCCCYCFVAMRVKRCEKGRAKEKDVKETQRLTICDTKEHCDSSWQSC